MIFLYITLIIAFVYFFYKLADEWMDGLSNFKLELDEDYFLWLNREERELTNITKEDN